MGDDRGTSVAFRPGTALVTEGTTSGAENWATGRFSAHWEASDGPDMRQGPEGVSVNDALAWAREQADAINVLTATGDQYSAGSEDIAGVPRWPAGGVVFDRREIRSAWYARVSPSSGSYTEQGPGAAHPLRGAGQEGRVRAEALRALLAETQAVSDTEVSIRDGEGWGVDCVVVTAHSGRAMRILEGALVDAGEDGTFFGSVSVSDHPV